MRTQPFPHCYGAAAAGTQAGAVSVTSPGLATFESGPAPQFGGDGTLWSPEVLLAAIVADCFILTFRAVSAAALFGWLGLECHVEATLGKVGRTPQFTHVAVRATLTLAPGADAVKANRLLKQAHRGCLIANALTAGRSFDAHIVHAPGGAAAPRR